jgi:hypothetical protein
MPSRREFLRSSLALGAFGAVASSGFARDFLSPTPAGASPTTWVCPTSIDNTGAQDVSVALWYWMQYVGQPGDTFQLRRGPGYAPGAYYIPRGVPIRRGIQLDLNGCWLFTGTEDGSQNPPLWDDNYNYTGNLWPRTRYCISVAASGAKIFSSLPNARIQGAARQAEFQGSEPYGCQYFPQYEGQHAIQMLGDGNVVDLTNIACEFTYGDGIYIVQGSTNSWIVGQNIGSPVSQNLGGTLSGSTWVPEIAVYPGIHHTARHGIAAVKSTNLIIYGPSIWHTGRAIFDLEPNGASDFVDGVVIANTETGRHNLMWLAAAGLRSVSNVVVQDNVCHSKLAIYTPQVNATARHSNWHLLRNQGGGVYNSPLDCFEVDRIDTLEIRDNHQVVSGVRSSMGIDIGTSTNVTISPSEDTQFPTS